MQATCLPCAVITHHLAAICYHAGYNFRVRGGDGVSETVPIAFNAKFGSLNVKGREEVEVCRT